MIETHGKECNGSLYNVRKQELIFELKLFIKGCQCNISIKKINLVKCDKIIVQINISRPIEGTQKKVNPNVVNKSPNNDNIMRRETIYQLV